MNRLYSHLSIDEIQFYLARGVEMHPLLYRALLEKIYDLGRAHKVCPTPQTILERYYFSKMKKVG
jgi:hypothetical protein